MKDIKSPVYVKIDFSVRENVLEQEEHILQTKYPIMVQNFINSLSLNEILSEKIRAVMNRKKHRDLYDLWVLFGLGSKFDIKLINKKFSYFEESFNKNLLMNELKKFDRAEFAKDLRPFVGVNDRDNLGNLFDYINKYLVEVFEKQA